MADEGLTFHPSPYDPPLGYAGFDVELGDDPSARYFDARRVSLPIEVDGVLKRQAVEHPWNQPPALRLYIHGGTWSCTDTVHSTLVLPHSASTEPGRSV